ncbi:Heat shock 70 kDa protein [Zea mays]|uniref:Heat shock 70 kDa protein n=1 Tax=Zea mays TaxID=4577 RepID=A0A1D6GMN5_MAIZE|nr:Heat shock 70 kDa protein [Zea mays]
MPRRTRSGKPSLTSGTMPTPPSTASRRVLESTGTRSRQRLHLRSRLPSLTSARRWPRMTSRRSRPSLRLPTRLSRRLDSTCLVVALAARSQDLDLRVAATRRRRQSMRRLRSEAAGVQGNCSGLFRSSSFFLGTQIVRCLR